MAVSQAAVLSSLITLFPSAPTQIPGCPIAQPRNTHPGAGGEHQESAIRMNWGLKKEKDSFSDLTKEHKEPIGRCLTNAALNSSQI